jgi:hypothetical protein
MAEKPIRVRDSESSEMAILRILHNRLNAYGWGGDLNCYEDGSDISVEDACKALREGYDAICDTQESST